MAFPQVVDTNTSIVTPSGTSHTVDLPANISAGDLLLVFFSTDGDNTISDWDGFTELFNLSNGTFASLSVGYKKATGGEGGTITITTTSSEHSAHVSYRITGHADPDSQAPEASTGAVDGSANPNPDSLTPTGGAKDYLWIAVEGNDDGTDTVISYPTGYDDNQFTIGTANSSFGCAIGIGSKEENDTSDDPGTFTIPPEQWVACTVAVHPAGEEPPPPSGTDQWVNIDDTLRQISTAWVNKDDTWHKMSEMWTNIDDTWHKNF